MSTETPNLHLEYVDPSQSQPEVKINDAWDKIDAAVGGLTGFTVEDVDSPQTTVSGVKTLKFSGATITEESNDSVLIEVTGGGGGAVSSVGLTSNATYIAQGGTASPITSTGTFTLDLSVAAKASLAAADTALQTVSVTNSITGDGAGTALKLSGDSASPGNNFYYGTNGSGTKGWYATTPGGVTSVGLTVNATYIAIGGTASPITSTGSFTLDLSTGAKANLALAATALQTVSVTNSITGDGSGTALKLSGDSASPGNSFYYGTNASGTKGWYASTAAPGTISVTDGTTSVASVTSLTVYGGKISGTSPNATLKIGGQDVPGTIPDLALWWASDDILGAAGGIITRLRERTPWITGIAGGNGSGKVIIDTPQVNGLNILKWPAASVNGTYTLPNSFLLATGGGTTGGTGGATYFLVARSSTATGTQAILGGGSNALALYMTNGGAKTVTLVKTGAAIIASSTTAWVNATAFQANATYNAATGAYAFRQGRASAGSGTGTTGAGTGLINTFGADGGTNLLNLASIAELIVYDRLLGSTEITAVENYLNAKWGV